MLNKVVDIQRREGLADGAMAARLGVSRPTWNRIRNGHLSFGDALAVRAAGVWPELTRDLLDLASASVSVRTEQETVQRVNPAPVLQSDTGDLD